jgi:ATP-dependent helicase HrpB
MRVILKGQLGYKPGESPVPAVKQQETTVHRAWSRASDAATFPPARRPIQVTQDLRGAWERTFAEVKKNV